MSQLKLTIALAVTAALLVLLVFTQHRWSMMASCHERGGLWYGPESRCRFIPTGIVIQKPLQRS